MFNRALAIAGGLLLLASCAVKVPEGVLSEEQMEELLFDYHKAKALGEVKRSEKSYDRDLYIDYVLDKYGVTEAQFDSSVAWYTRHLDTYTTIYRHVDKRIREQQSVLNKLVALRTHVPQKTLQGDSIDVWYLQRNLLMSSMPAENKLSFSFSTDGNFADKDSIWWRVHAIILHKDKVSPVRYIPIDTIAVAVNDSMSKDSVLIDTIYPKHSPYAVMQLEMQYPHQNIAQSVQIDATGWYSIKLQANELGRLRTVKGFVYFSRLGLYRPAMLVDSVQLIRIHQSSEQAKQIADSLQALTKRLQTQKDSIEAASKVPVESKKEKISPRRLTPLEQRQLQNLKKVEDEVKE